MYGFESKKLHNTVAVVMRLIFVFNVFMHLIKINQYVWVCVCVRVCVCGQLTHVSSSWSIKLDVVAHTALWGFLVLTFDLH